MYVAIVKAAAICIWLLQFWRLSPIGYYIPARFSTAPYYVCRYVDLKSTFHKPDSYDRFDLPVTLTFNGISLVIHIFKNQDEEKTWFIPSILLEVPSNAYVSGRKVKVVHVVTVQAYLIMRLHFRVIVDYDEILLIQVMVYIIMYWPIKWERLLTYDSKKKRNRSRNCTDKSQFAYIMTSLNRYMDDKIVRKVYAATFASGLSG